MTSQPYNTHPFTTSYPEYKNRKKRPCKEHFEIFIHILFNLHFLSFLNFSLRSYISIVSGKMNVFLISSDSSSFIVFMYILKLNKYFLINVKMWLKGECFNWPQLKIMRLVETVTKTLVVQLVVHELSFSKKLI